MTIRRLSTRPLAALLFALAASWFGPTTVLADRPDDPGFVQFRGSSFPIEESAGHVDVVVRRHRGDTGAVSVDFATTDGSAIAGEDYTAATGTLSWGDGDDDDKIITIEILADDVAEGEETFGVQLSNPTGDVEIGSLSSTVVRIKPQAGAGDGDGDGDGDGSALVEAAEADWVAVRPRGRASEDWWMRSRKRAGRAGWVVVLCPREEEQRRSDARMRILLDERGGTLKRTLVDRGPVVVIERDGIVRRLLVAQIERAGALCYPSDDLQSALRLLAAEPRVQSVIIDFALAGSEMADWVARIRAQRPDIHLIATGGIGAEAMLLEQGFSRVLRKPWRINDLIDALGA